MSFNRLPSVKTLSDCFGSRAAEARRLLEWKHETFPYKSVQDLIASYYNKPSYQFRLMTALNEIGGFYGVEYIPHGRNKKSPSIHYLNSGDFYSCTLMILDDKRIVVGCVGDVIERGNYE